MAKKLQNAGEWQFVKPEPQPFLIDLNIQNAFLQRLLDIGEIKSENLLSEFHTPYQVIQALLASEITYSKTGKPKGITGPLKFLPKIILINQ